MGTQNKRMDGKHSVSSIFGSYILNNRTVPGVRQYTSKEKEALKNIMDEMSSYSEQA